MSRCTCYTLGLAAVVLALSPLRAADPPPSAKATKPQGPTVGKWSAASSKGVVLAGGAEAVDAGIEILAANGNAADAAAAVILAQSITDADQFCFGGEVPILAYSAERRVVEAIAGQGAAPRLATREYFAQRGGIPKKGIEPACVPGALDACLTLLDRQGTKTFKEVIAPTLRILDRKEHPWHEALAATLRRLVEAENAAADRRQGLRLVADYFYRGPIARELDQWSREQGGLLRFADLASHVTRVEEPLFVSYRGRKVYKCGFWTQGPYLLETLNILEGFDVDKHAHNSSQAIHLAAEALKLGLADRDKYYGDPLFTTLPQARLLSPDYASERRKLIDPGRASLELRPGAIPEGAIANTAPATSTTAVSSQDTTTCLVADGQGNVVAATPSGWSGTLCEPLGVWLGTRLQSFCLDPEHPNCIEPGKRPRITLTPTIVLEDDRPALAVSVAGGDHQDQVTLQMLMNLIDYRLSVEEAVTRPRFVTEHYISSFGQAAPKLGSLTLGGEIGEGVIAELKALGHNVTAGKGRPAVPLVIQFDRASGAIRGAGDPSHARHAAGL
jgi:gamma-glutamyltranspeptidase/glutathione hydrolase